jgi:hypothetical protein
MLETIDSFLFKTNFVTFGNIMLCTIFYIHINRDIVWIFISNLEHDIINFQLNQEGLDLN